MKDGDFSADDLRGVLDDDPGPETVRDAIMAAMQADGAGDEPTPFAPPADTDEPTDDDRAPGGAAEPQGGQEAASGDDGKGNGGKAPEAGNEHVTPPADWSAAEHEMFHKLAPEAQRFVLDKAKSFQADYTKKTEEVARERERFASLDKVIAPRVAGWKMNGWEPAQALDRLMAISDFASQRPAEFVAWFAKENKVDLAALAPKPVAPEEDEYVDPQVKALRDEIAALKAGQEEVRNGFKTREQQEAEAAQRQREQVLRDFEVATDEKGAPKHPYFRQVAPVMGALIQAGRAADMETAYAMAVYADPEVRAKIDAAEKAARAREAAAEQRRRSENARRAGSSITGSPAGSTAPAPKATLREEIVAAAQGAGWRI